jgi:hypothetical protein
VRHISRRLTLMLESVFHAGYHLGRNIAGVAAASMWRDGEEKGRFNNRIRGVLCEEEYVQLCQDKGLMLETISYCQKELNCVRDSLQSCRRVPDPNFDETEEVSF